MLRFRRATYNWCLLKTHVLPSQDTQTHFLNVQTGELILSSDLTAVIVGSFPYLWLHIRVPLPAGLHGSSLPQKCALNVPNELICPHRLSQRCWMTGTPPGTLPTQTYNCSPTPAASFALCKPLLCHQSVKWKKHMFKKHPKALWLNVYLTWRPKKPIKTVSHKSQIHECQSSCWHATNETTAYTHYPGYCFLESITKDVRKKRRALVGTYR